MTPYELRGLILSVFLQLFRKMLQCCFAVAPGMICGPNSSYGQGVKLYHWDSYAKLQQHKKYTVTKRALEVPIQTFYTLQTKISFKLRFLYIPKARHPFSHSGMFIHIIYGGAANECSIMYCGADGVKSLILGQSRLAKSKLSNATHSKACWQPPAFAEKKKRSAAYHSAVFNRVSTISP